MSIYIFEYIWIYIYSICTKTEIFSILMENSADRWNNYTSDRISIECKRRKENKTYFSHEVNKSSARISGRVSERISVFIGSERDYWANYIYLRDSLFAHKARRVCRWQLGSYILRAVLRRSQTALWRGGMEVSKKYRQTIYSVCTCRARLVVVTRNDKSYTNTSSRCVTSTSFSVALPRVASVSLCDSGESLWKFRRNSKAKSNMGVFHEVSR